MTIELNPVGVKCNLACRYCYETEMRDAGNYGPKDYDLVKMTAGLLDELRASSGENWTLHGGEPLLLPLDDLEELWRWGKEAGHTLGIQTNGSLITHAHIDLAQRYQVHFGISMDGPGSMNDLRNRPTVDGTREATAASEAAVEKLCAAGVGTSVIIVLHKLNMDPDRRAEFKAWIRHLDEIGVRGVRFHPMEMDGKAHPYMATVSDYVEFYRDLRQFMQGLSTLRIDIIEDIRALLRGEDDHTTCTWNTCDPYTTGAVHGVDGQGSRSNCGRTNKDGVSHPKAARVGYERYLALYHTPQEHGGCQGCRFFAMCSGQCPGEGIDGDWRNRSMYCGLYMALFGDVEEEMINRGETPLSISPQRASVEQVLIEHWAQGNRTQLHSVLHLLEQRDQAHPEHTDIPHGDHHGDHTDADRIHVPSPHGDAPHGDAHGDHTDTP